MHNVQILISETQKSDLNIKENYSMIALGSVLLKDKLDTIEIFIIAQL
jgi:hypothetical protein